MATAGAHLHSREVGTHQAYVRSVSHPRRSTKAQRDAEWAAVVAAGRAREAAKVTTAPAAPPAPPAPRSIASRRLAAVADMRAADCAQLRHGARVVTVEWAAAELNVSVKTARAYARTGRLELTELGVRTYNLRRIDRAVRTGTVGWLAADNPPASRIGTLTIAGRVVR